MRRVTTYFARGLLFLVPIVVTMYVLYMVFIRVDQIFRFSVPGVGFLLTLVLITGIGFLVSTVLARGAANVIDNLFGRMPVGKMIYSSIKDLMNAFVGDQRQFDKPVLVSPLPGSGVRIMGFVTRESLTKVGDVEGVAVYIPQSFNFGGNLILVPKAQVTPLDIPSGPAMAFIVSGGVSGP